MTVTLPIVKRPDHPDPIYPYSVSQHCPVCMSCFQRHEHMAWCADPDGHGLLYLCRDCSRPLAAGRPAPLPTGEKLVETWLRVARLHHNEQMTDADLDRALTNLAPRLAWKDGRDAVANLADAMLHLQKAEDPATVLDQEITGPDLDPETYWNLQQTFAEDALAKLIRGQR